MSLVDSKAGESWTELDPADDSTYSLPIFLSVGKYRIEWWELNYCDEKNETNF